ncbi:hypothetical protein AMJ83_03735 [candidate division WOR_3 bacterium SM23_42]|uniref:TonB-dependent receptor-like beta-barrel domain-containing protein n=1 Tax=candidate division WOR_3 bacterium SM23_42 TaxID=1703779 RepID=A0A0S8FTS3_UNCW3|nr:MAG: hypothetical protein AMJ83_03735 [candidate division WOR_3 bacterium SM23_42]
MIFLAFLIVYDSLPPLPDLSRLYFPEPVLWVEPAERSITLAGYAGQFGGVRVNTRVPGLDIRGAFESKNEWDSTETGNAYVSYSMRLPRIWFRPRIGGYLLTRGDEYQLLTPGFDLIVFSSFALLSSEVDYNRWKINGVRSSESGGTISLIFDRTKYLPSLTFSGRYTNQEFKPTLAGKLHTKNLHLTLGSAVAGVLSPLLRVVYSQPVITIAAQIRRGIEFNTLYEYFQPEIPLQYRIPIPDETLRVSVDLDTKLNFYDHSITIRVSYKDWQYRLAPGGDYQVSHTKDTREVNARLRIHDIFQSNLLDIRNTCNIHYTWTDSTISFLPKYVISDTLDIFFGLLEIGADLRYVSSRPGLEDSLPHYYLISTNIGLRIKYFKPYFSIYNINNTRSKIFDDYYLAGRQYGGGLNVSWRF